VSLFSRTRLAAVPTPGRRALSTALALAAAGLGACGSEDGTIPPQDAEALLAQLEEVEAAVEDGNCTSAQTDVSQLTAEVNALPKEVGVETKDSLRRLSENLSELVNDPEQCDEQTGATGETFEETTEPTTTTPTTETTTTTAEEEEAPPEQPEDEGTGVPPEAGNGPPGQEGNLSDGGGVGEED
jgi:hypothetical protein